MLYRKWTVGTCVAALPICLAMWLYAWVQWTVIEVEIDRFDSELIPTGVELTLFEACFALSLCAYCQTIVTDPGSPGDHTGRIQGSLLLMDGTYCQRCAMNRPARTHHCAVCQRCVLRRDHHCVWVGNCIGAYNHKFFVLFLVYTAGCCLIALWTISRAVTETDDLTPDLVLLSLCCGAMFVLVSLMALFQLWLLATNRTSADLSTTVDYNPFDSGSWRENVRAVCGGPKLWLVPVLRTGELGCEGRLDV